MASNSRSCQQQYLHHDQDPCEPNLLVSCRVLLVPWTKSQFMTEAA